MKTAARFSMPIFPEADTSICWTGYHGTLADIAREIASKQQIIPSENKSDWLGRGAYFWQDNPQRALSWARERYPGRTVAVVRARIRSGRCLNLLDDRYKELVKQAAGDLTNQYEEEGLHKPRNTENGYFAWDCAVLNHLCENAEPPVDTICCAYHFEGPPLYDDSAICTKSHIQICVRNTDCILTLELHDFPMEAPL
jgi:hypothetical protein